MSIMSSILDEITAQRRVDVADAKRQKGEDELRTAVDAFEKQYGPPLDVLARLNAPPMREGWSRMALAAEFKRASPSKGDIAVALDIADQARKYARGGASMISVLTEPKWFKGSLEDMKLARETVDELANRPAILRKDFIIDEYQLLEARAHGADCVLLIVAILSPSELEALIKAAHALKMCPLVEVNSVEELEIALNADAKLIGVNNRNLRSFKMDLDTTVRIADELRKRKIPLGPEGVTLLALSGIHSRSDVVRFERCGARGILVGEFLMKSNDVDATLAKLLDGRRHSVDMTDVFFPQPLIKICGITKLEYAMTALRAGANMVGLIFVKSSPRCISMEEAKRIAHAVQQYGEREGPILPQMIEEELVDQASSTMEWFQRNASALRRVSSRAPLVVGVFANQSPEEVNAIATEVGLDIVQLHGDEGFEACRQINFPTARVIHLPDTYNIDSVDSEAILHHIESNAANFILLDTTIKGQKGGTGVTFDWNIATRFQQAGIPCLMAGGLTTHNVHKAITLGRPLGVDVSSGVESAPGVKDLEQVEEFVKIVKNFFSCVTTAIDETPELASM